MFKILYQKLHVYILYYFLVMFIFPQSLKNKFHYVKLFQCLQIQENT